MGTALGVLLARGGATVRLWAREPARAAEIDRDRENARHLKGVPLPEGVQATGDATEALRGSDWMIVAVPSAFLRETLTRVAAAVPAGLAAVSVVKGIERGTSARPSRIIAETLGERPVAVLSGPSHAEEFARGLPASVVVASEDESLSVRVRDALHGESFRVYSNTDALGVELAGALKNVLGVAAGISDGLGFGDNAKAALLTRGLVEIARFAVALGARPETFWGLAGVGDVLTTCYSPYGRNRALGMRIGRGESLAEVQGSMTDVAEGAFTTRSVVEQARSLGIAMPIAEEVHAILFEDKPPRAAVTDLMARDPKFE
jgi:glycerol-3-phosphate dehydrogenase (NAD(P)+)